MEYFDMSDKSEERFAEIMKHSAEELNAPLDPDPATGIQQVAELLTFLPENERLAAVNRFITSMLSTAS